MDSNAKSDGIGLGGIIFVVFLALKLTGFITWSWWWITAPLWIPFALFFGIMAMIGVCAIFAATVTRSK